MLGESHQEWFYFVAIYNTCITHVNIMKKVRWEGIEMCDIFGGTRIFSQASRSFKGGRVMYPDEERTYRGLDNFIPDEVDPCRYGFLILVPRGHDCWEKSINRKSIDGLLMHAERAHYGTFQKRCFISYVHI